MSIILTWVSYENEPIPYKQIKEFDEQDESFTLGRSSSNDFVVHDPENYASRKHATILFFENDWYIEDTSSVGTVINNDRQLNQESLLLLDGDTITIGDCEYKISITETSKDIDTDDSTRLHRVTADEQFEEDNNIFNVIDFDEPNNDDNKITRKKTQQVEPIKTGGLSDAIKPQTSPAPKINETEDIISDDQNDAFEAIQAFYENLGLSESELKNKSKTEVLLTTAELLRALVTEFMDLNILPKKIEQQYDVSKNVTKSKHNPIQNSDTANIAIKKLICHDANTQEDEKALTATQYIADNAKELKQYQSVILSSVTNATLAAIKQFDPKILEKKFKPVSPISTLISQDGKVWNEYKKQYESLRKDALKECQEEIKSGLTKIANLHNQNS